MATVCVGEELPDDHPVHRATAQSLAVPTTHCRRELNMRHDRCTHWPDMCHVQMTPHVMLPNHLSTSACEVDKQWTPGCRLRHGMATHHTPCSLEFRATCPDKCTSWCLCRSLGAYGPPAVGVSLVSPMTTAAYSPLYGAAAVPAASASAGVQATQASLQVSWHAACSSRVS